MKSIPSSKPCPSLPLSKRIHCLKPQTPNYLGKSEHLAKVRAGECRGGHLDSMRQETQDEYFLLRQISILRLQFILEHLLLRGTKMGPRILGATHALTRTAVFVGPPFRVPSSFGCGVFWPTRSSFFESD